jgi:hypothetical protein
MHSAPLAYERHPQAATRLGPKVYQRRKPEESVLYGIVSRKRKACIESAQERSSHGYGYPSFVEREFDKFLGCGQLRRGFVRVKCAECPNEKLVAFSCKGRGLCPSCTARRMANTAAHLVDRVLPRLPTRQWVLSFPRRVRILLAKDHDLLSKVLDMALKKIFAWQKRRARKLGYQAPACGAIGFVQRFGSLLNLNCHFHNLVPDGVFVDTETGLQFCPTPAPWLEDIERLVKQIAHAAEKLITKRSEELCDEEPELLHAEQARSLAEPAAFPESPASTSPRSGQRSAFFYGYSLHAERFVDADDRDGLEKLCRYAARAPIANSRLSLDTQGNAVLNLKRPLRDGRLQLKFTQLQLLQKLAILIPPPRKNLTRYFGVFAPAHRFRKDVVAIGRETQNETEPSTNSTAIYQRRIPWAELLKRVFAIDILKCDQCGEPMKILAVIPESQATKAILDHLGIDTGPSNATGPPGH